MKAQERRAEAAKESFDDARKKLYKGFGKRRESERIYSAKEHGVRLGMLSRRFSEELDGILSEVEEDIGESRRAARGLGYTDPTAGLAAPERDRLAASAPLVSEDCKRLSWPELADRLEAVDAGEDRAAKILHARSGGARQKDDGGRLGNLARAGQRDASSGADKHARGRVRDALSRLEASLEDPEARKRKEAAERAVERGRSLAARMRRMRSEADGTDAAARRGQEEATRAAF